MNAKKLIKERYDQELGKLFEEMFDKMTAVADEAYKSIDEIGMTTADMNDLEKIAKKHCTEFIINKLL